MILIKIFYIHSIAIVLVLIMVFINSYPIVETLNIFTSIGAPLLAYGYIFLRPELRDKEVTSIERMNHFLWSLYAWLIFFIILLYLKWGPFVDNLNQKDFDNTMNYINSIKIFFFAFYIPIFFPEPKEENEN